MLEVNSLSLPNFLLVFALLRLASKNNQNNGQAQITHIYLEQQNIQQAGVEMCQAQSNLNLIYFGSFGLVGLVRCVWFGRFGLV